MLKQRDTTTHLLECLKFKRLTILSVGEDMVQQELLYTSGVGVK